ncbi:DUF6809 family protein [Anaerorhabdus sp.]|uniref:DUF6809 family protein n=1 Tax=Anaerorhabdus sp. TaxID=1872524 RepID=UPI002FC7F951
MEDILRTLYNGEYTAVEGYKLTERNYELADEKATELSNNIIKTLDESNFKNADQVVEEWLDAYYNLTNEELINCFKKGVKLGFQLCKELID